MIVQVTTKGNCFVEPTSFASKRVTKPADRWQYWDHGMVAARLLIMHSSLLNFRFDGGLACFAAGCQVQVRGPMTLHSSRGAGINYRYGPDCCSSQPHSRGLTACVHAIGHSSIALVGTEAVYRPTSPPLHCQPECRLKCRAGDILKDKCASAAAHSTVSARDTHLSLQLRSVVYEIDTPTDMHTMCIDPAQHAVTSAQSHSCASTYTVLEQHISQLQGILRFA